MTTIKSADWELIEKRLKHYRHLFMKNNHFHLFNLEQLQARFDEGERTPELASEIEVIIGNGD